MDEKRVILTGRQSGKTAQMLQAAYDENYLLRQKLAKSEARVAGIKQIIATEPELPGEMPEEMWQAFVDAINEGDRAFVTAALRIAVKETKNCILDRIHEAERAGGET